MIRIIGLSATLPNYMDVAKFLHVNPFKGLFFFDGRFRPVPLGQSFIGIKGNNHIQILQRMDEVCYEKVLENVDKGNQVHIFFSFDFIMLLMFRISIFLVSFLTDIFHL